MHVLHIITSLGAGGAERALFRLAVRLKKRGIESTVVSLTSLSTIGREMEIQGVTAHALGGRLGLMTPLQFRRLIAIGKRSDMDVIHCWMYHANMAGHLLRGIWFRSVPLICSVRGALHAPRRQKLLTRIVRRLDAALSSNASAIVYNSQVAARQHEEIGYATIRRQVIPNGFDLSAFYPDRAKGTDLRKERRIAADVRLIGMVARFNPLKGHADFLRSIALARTALPNARYLLVGRGCDSSNRALARMAREAGVADIVLMLGEQEDMLSVYNCLDVCVCSSISESFPNAIGEAMACGIPCIVTDVGDCAFLVGPDGVVVPASDACALSKAIVRLASLASNQRLEVGARLRNRVQSDFSIDSVVDRYEALYRELARS